MDEIGDFAPSETGVSRSPVQLSSKSNANTPLLGLHNRASYRKHPPPPPIHLLSPHIYFVTNPRTHLETLPPWTHPFPLTATR